MSGPRLPFRRVVAVAATLLVALGGAVGLAGCGAKNPSRAQLTQALVDSGISRSVAQCTADAIEGSLTPAQLRLIVERGPAAAPVDDPNRSDDAADRLSKALQPCIEKEQAAETASSTTVPG